GFILSPETGSKGQDGNWHFLVGTYDQNSVRLFMDGVEIGTGTPTNLPIIYNKSSRVTDLFHIGAYAADCYLGFNGDIDEVRIFSRPLTATEIQTVYKAEQMPPLPPNQIILQGSAKDD